MSVIEKKPLINIAVISDLHVGAAARSADLCPQPNEKHEKCFLKDFTDFICDETITADYLLISGDISHKAAPDEFALAYCAIEKIHESLKIPIENVIFVPGNHDVDWSNAKLWKTDKSGLRYKQRYDPLRHGTTLFTKALARGHGDILNDPFITKWVYDELVVYGYNSSWDDNQDACIHHGVIHEKHIKEMAKLLYADKAANKDLLKIFTVHHHATNSSNPAEEPDFSAMQNADKLLDLLRSHKFDMLVHGHKHYPRVKQSVEDSGFPLIIIGSGSFSLTLEMPLPEHVSNLFHMIRIDERSKDDGCIKGRFESWAYSNGIGWRKSQSRSDGIDYSNPFGTHALPENIKKCLKDFFISKEAKGTIVAWSDVKADLGYQHLPITTAKQVMGEIADEEGWKFMETTELDFLILFTK